MTILGLPCIARNGRRLAGLVLVGALFGVAAAGTNARQADDAKLLLHIEQPGQSALEMAYWLATQRLRMDTAQMSLVWIGGQDPRMLMIQHAEKRFMEWTEQQLSAMRQMMRRVPGANQQATPEPPDFSGVSFTVTGERGRIADQWDAIEVRVEGLDAGQEGFLWISEDASTGLLEVFSRVADVMSDMQLPMGMGGNNPQEALLRYSAFARASGLPSGRVVQVVGSQNGPQTTITLVGVQPGPFDGDPFAPPGGYEPMRIPAFPND